MKGQCYDTAVLSHVRTGEPQQCLVYHAVLELIRKSQPLIIKRARKYQAVTLLCVLWET